MGLQKFYKGYLIRKSHLDPHNGKIEFLIEFENGDRRWYKADKNSYQDNLTYKYNGEPIDAKPRVKSD